MGGFSLGTAFDELVLDLARGPRVLFVPTAAEDARRVSIAFYESFGPRAEPTHISFNPWPPTNLRDVVLAHDVVYVSGGNTANALAVWRVHGFHAILRDAWENGVLLCGWSAGMICWFEASVTDSFGPALAGMRDGLGFLPGSACPHYDGEAPRIAPHRDEMRDRLAEALGVGRDQVNVRATTTDRLGFTGRREGLAAQAVALLRPR
jgi:peptidase E